MSQETNEITIAGESSFHIEADSEGSVLWQVHLPDYSISVVGSCVDISDRMMGIMFYVEQREPGNLLARLPGQLVLLRQGKAPVGRYLRRSTPVNREINFRFEQTPTYQDVVNADVGEVVYTVLYGDMTLVRVIPIELEDDRLGFSIEVPTKVSYEEFSFEHEETVEFDINDAIQVQSFFRDSATLTLVQRYIQNEDITSVDVIRCQFSQTGNVWVRYIDGDLSEKESHQVFSTMSGFVHGTYLTLRRGDEIVGNIFMQLTLEEGIGYLRVFRVMKK